MKKTKLPHDTYQSDIWFVRGTIAELQRFSNRTFTSLSDEERAIEMHTGGKFYQYQRDAFVEYYILYAPGSKFTRAFAVSLLVHECAHLAAAVLTDHGVKWDTENDEAFTYYLQWLVFNCLYLMWGKAGR